MATANIQAARPVKTASSNPTNCDASRPNASTAGSRSMLRSARPTSTISSPPSTGKSAAPQIKGENGELIFEQTNCEVPSFWSQLATNVICSKYFYGEVGTPEREYSVKQLVHRVARTIADWGLEDGYFASPQDGERFYRDLAWLCLHQHGAFNSPVWFNVGLYHQYGVTGAKCNWRWDPQSPRRRAAREPVRVPARLGLLHPTRRRQHGRHHGARPQRGHALQVRLRHRHRPLDAPLAPRKARRRRQALAARSRSCGSTTRSPRS